MIVTYKDIKLTYPDDMPLQEAERYCQDEIDCWAAECPEKVIASVEVKIDGDAVTVGSKERSPISRIRRITGYCVNLNSMADHKRAEVAARVVHC